MYVLASTCTNAQQRLFSQLMLQLIVRDYAWEHTQRKVDVVVRRSKHFLEIIELWYLWEGTPRCRNDELKSSVKESIQAIIYCKGKVIQKRMTLPEKHGALHLDARVFVQGFPCKGLNFRLTLIAQCNCGSSIFAHIFAEPHPARTPGACESCYYS